MIKPGATIGILGGGQLGRMMALSGRGMGYRFICLDPAEDSSCGQVCDEQIVASYDDLEAARELGRRSDLITFEFENVSSAVVKALEEEFFMPQGGELLHLARNRRREKEALRAIGADVAVFQSVLDEGSFLEALDAVGLPGVLKTVEGGYDGKGQRVIRALEEAQAAFEALRGRGELIFEEFIDFEKELSVVVARGRSGEVRSFSVAENIHVQNILHLSIAPARVEAKVAARAERLAVQIAEQTGLVGVLGVELFLTRDGRLLVNELAPRPHNSGHFTMDGAWTSQFEQHLRAICGLPLGDPGLFRPVVMVNLLGEQVPGWLEEMQRPAPSGLEVKTHFYGKSPARPGRKMGHINIICVGADVERALAWVEESKVWRIRGGEP